MVDGARRREGAGLGRLPQGLREERRGQALPLRLRRLRHRDPAGVQLQPHQPARPRLGLRHRPHPRRRRPRATSGSSTASSTKRTNTFNDFVDVAKGLIARSSRRPGQDRDQRRLGRRRADGRGRELRSRAVGRGGRRRAVRRRAQHHARRHAAADPRRVARMGQSDHRRGGVRPTSAATRPTTMSRRRTIRRC